MNPLAQFAITFIFNMKRASSKTHGFIALISILIVSSVLLVTTLSLAERGIAHRFFLLKSEQKSMSEQLAEACIHIARIKAHNDPGYTISVDETFLIGEETCSIHRVTQAGNETTMETTAQVGHAITNLRAVLNPTQGVFLSWEAVPRF